MSVLASIIIGFLVAFAAPWIHRATRDVSGWVLAILPLALTVFFASFIPALAGDPIRQSVPWIDGLGIQLSFYIDGLSVMFALLISAIGTFIVIYAGGYLKGHPYLGRFYVSLLMFMMSMLGVVLADNIITLFVFWELTSFTSYLLIGFNHEQERARKAALQALLVTGSGGLALLAGLILMGIAGGTYEISELLNQGDAIQASGLYVGILILVLAGTFTKSAQVPFHFWLPSAMEAPTPVSAYLHSATMVKAGIYLMARLHPALGGTDLWFILLTSFGAATMVIGSWLALSHTDLKRVLAYSTVMALGTLTMLLGMGRTQYAIIATAVFIVAHSLYKGALFMVAGTLDHETGTRDVSQLGGLRKAMPVTATAAAIAALSMAGVAPFFGFIGKELVYEATLASETLAVGLAALAILANVAGVAAAGIVAVRPFFGVKKETPKHAHEAPASMWLGPISLGIIGLVFGILPGLIGTPLLSPTWFAVAGEEVLYELVLWPGFTPVLGLSVLTFAMGIGVLVYWDKWRRSPMAVGFNTMLGVGPERGYEASLDGMLWFAHWQTRFLQSGYLRYYILTIVSVMAVAVWYTMFAHVGFHLSINLSDVSFYEWTLAALLVAGSLTAILARSRLAMVIAIGVVGYSIALIYIIYSAPDVAITQLLVETLTVILVALVLIHLPKQEKQTPVASRARDAIIAVVAGATLTLLILAVLPFEPSQHLSEYFAENSYVVAHGRNIVNVILVDFRALDTMGEIVVLGIAGLGVYSLIKLRGYRQRQGESAR